MSIESVMPSYHLILCHLLLLLSSIFPGIRVFSNESVLHIRWPMYWSFSFSISPSNEYSGLILSRIDQFNILAVQGTLKESSPAPQFKGAEPSLWSNSHIQHDYWRNHSFGFSLNRTLLEKWCLCFLIHCLGLSQLFFQGQASFNFMAAVTICSDFGAQENSQSLYPLFLHLVAVKWWNRIPWSSFSECCVLSQLFHSLFSPLSRGSLVPLRFLP